MRKIIAAWFVGVMLAVVLTGCVAVVRTRPAHERAGFMYAQPYSNAVWIKGHYERRHNDWIWIAGHWERRH